MSVARRVLIVALVVASTTAGAFAGAGSRAEAQTASPSEITAVCVNPYTGVIRYAASPTACSPSEQSVALPDDGPLYACINAWTGLLRAVAGVGQCQGGETALDLAAVDAVDLCVNRFTGRLRSGACTANEFAGFILPVNVPSVYVADSGGNAIKQFDLDGQFIREWGSLGNGPGDFFDLFRIAVGPDGHVYATDGQNCRVQKFTYYGAYVDEWGGCGTAPGQFTLLPSGIAVDSQSNVFVGDLFAWRVQKFDGSGGFINEWGGAGTGPGQFLLVLEIAVGSNDHVFVTDPAPFIASRVQEFDNDGNYVDEWLIADVPVAIDIGTLNDIAYVTTLADTFIKIDASNGTILTQWGTTGSGDGQLDEPQGVAVTSNGLVYVTDRANDRVQYFDADGIFLGEWGSSSVFDDIIGIAATP